MTPEPWSYLDRVFWWLGVFAAGAIAGEVGRILAWMMDRRGRRGRRD